MTRSIFKKHYKLRLFISCAVTLAVLFLVNYLLRGPYLGPVYDLLMHFRRPPAISPELVLIETGCTADSQDSHSLSGNIIEPAAVTSVVTTLTELNAGALLIQAPVLGVSLGNGKTEDDLQGQFDEEFALLGENIRNLFHGIRVGSISPGESDQYVADLVGLTERGKDRLLAAFLSRDESAARLLERASAAFGAVWQTGGLAGAENNADTVRWHSRPQPDSDGVLRRIAPILRSTPAGDAPETETEHIAFAALKSRFEQTELITRGAQLQLRLTNAEGERVFNLDSQGRLWIEKPRGDADFRRVPLSVFTAYEQGDLYLYRLLVDAEKQGYFAYINPEDYPTFLYKNAQILRDEML
jgi:hypothetical protein